MKEILLSICIPTYNRAEIVYQCVKQCLEIESDQIEVVVNDNCSTDNTKALLGDIKDERFCYYCNDSNIGYPNFSVALKKAKGKYALLLSDEDDIINLNLEETIKQLADAKGTAVFQCEYYDEFGNRLLSGPPERFEGDTGRIYCYTLCYFAYAGALIINTEILERVWDRIDKEGVLWKLYPHSVIAEYCVQEGALDKFNKFQIRRSDRNIKGTLDTKSWNGGGVEPYWTMGARKEQCEAWIKMFAAMKLDVEKLNRIYLEILVQWARHVVRYRHLLKNELYKDEILYIKRKDIVEKDLKMKKIEWFKMFFGTRNYLKKLENEYLKKRGSRLVFDKVHYKRMVREVIKLIKNM